MLVNRIKHYHIKDFIGKISIFFPLLFMVVLINFFIDPANIFSRDYEKKAAKILLEGLNVANLSNCDERIFQRCYIENLKEKKNIVVLGASLVMQINQDMFLDSGLTLVNNGVSGASLEDYMAIYEIYRENGKEPDVILLGLSPWLLNKNNGQTRWKSISNYYKKCVARIEAQKGDFESTHLKNKWVVVSPKVEKYLQIFSPTYFQKSVRYFLKKIKNKSFKKIYYATKETELDVPVKMYDGSINYGNKYRLANLEDIKRKVNLILARKQLYSLGRFHELDPLLKQRFEMFVADLFQNNIQIKFILMPYYPAVYRFLLDSPEHKIILEEEEYFRNIASKYEIDVIGSYNPDLCDFNETDFYDDIHLKRKAVYELIENNLLLSEESKS